MQGILGKKSRLIVIAFIAGWVGIQKASARILDEDEVGYLSKKKYSFDSSLNVSAQSRAVIEIEDPDLPKKPFGLELSFSTRGSTLQDGNIQSNLSASFIGINFDWNVTKWLKAKFIGGYQFAAGNAANVFGSEGNPYSGEAFDEAAFIATFDRLQIAAGVIDTEFNPISSTFDPGGFAGLRQSYKLDSSAFRGSLNAYQVAASGGGVANRALDDEKNPLLTIANLNAGFKFERFSGNIGFTKFDFYGLTSASAGASRFLGNSIIGDGNGIVFYRYKYRGQEISANSTISFRLDDRLGLSGNLTQNDEAPAKRNFGWMGRAFYEYNFRQYSIRPSVTRFRFEPDVIPGYASRGAFGFLNRDGYAGEIRATFKKYNLDGYIRYLDAKEVEPKPAQTDRIGLTVGLEVKYVIL